MLKPCGVVELCSPRGPTYSGKLIARAVELYLNGVKTGYIRWHEVQHTLEKEFPSELKEAGQDKPAPETVMAWARKYPDARQRLNQLGVQAAPDHDMAWRPIGPSNCQLPQAISVPHSSINTRCIEALLGQFMAFMALVIMTHCVRAMVQN